MPKSPEERQMAEDARNLNVLNKRALAAEVATATGLNANQSKAAVEAVLRALFAALKAEKKVVLPPLGKIVPKRQQAGTEKEKMVYRLVLAEAEN